MTRLQLLLLYFPPTNTDKQTHKQTRMNEWNLFEARRHTHTHTHTQTATQTYNHAQDRKQAC